MRASLSEQTDNLSPRIIGDLDSMNKGLRLFAGNKRWSSRHGVCKIQGEEPHERRHRPMRYLVLAADYDGTLATHGQVEPTTVEALERLRATGRKLVLVTGRELAELFEVFPHTELFERIVTENGGLLYRPASREEKALAAPPPERLITTLKQRGVAPISVGRVIVATWAPHQAAVHEVIRALGLELHVILNKGAVMVLPSGVDKATGLAAALDELSIAPQDVVGIGDAENDHAFLELCGCSAAVANALPALKERVDLVMTGARGAGVVELIDKLIADEAAARSRRGPL
jgi:HAD superfamily hydrolase (TIGR01484 family)